MGGDEGDVGDDVGALVISSARSDGATRITVSGELDGFTAESLRAAVAEAEGDVELDLEGVSFIDSSGLAAIIEAHLALADQQRRLRTVASSPVVQRLFALSGLEARLET
jgi:anti-anti-sigma factor